MLDLGCLLEETCRVRKVCRLTLSWFSKFGLWLDRGYLPEGAENVWAGGWGTL